MRAEAAPQNGDEMTINWPNNPFSNRAFRLQARRLVVDFAAYGG
jgi:hypothetical protein